jgi:hypothetical protein
MGMYPTWILIVTGLVLKLKWSFKSEHRDKLIYLKGNKGGFYLKINVIDLTSMLSCISLYFFNLKSLSTSHINVRLP